jgi:hypothetical protein
MSKLVPEVAAQSEPTFPYDGPFEDPGPTPTPSGEASVKLTTTTSSLQVSDTVNCDLSIESGSEEVQSYTIYITFDPNVLEVVDSNTTQSGVQISFTDTFSSVGTNSSDNTSGTAVISAEISGASQTVNRKIAQITFRAKQAGTSIVSINKSQSSVINDVSEDILGVTTSLNFTVTGQTGTNNGQLPSSGIFDSFAAFGGLTAGILLLYVGIKAVIDRKKEDSGF